MNIILKIQRAETIVFDLDCDILTHADARVAAPERLVARRAAALAKLRNLEAAALARGIVVNLEC